MKGFLEEYGLIIVVVAVILLMLLFGKSGYAKSIQGAILGSVDHIVEIGDNITKSDKKEVHVTAGDMLDIEGTKYVVLEQKENNQVLVMTASSIGSKKFQPNNRADGQIQSTYENSYIDNYLENNWYKGLSDKMKKAIQTTNIKQASYDRSLNKQETGYNGQVYNTISRHAFLPSVDEIGKAVDLKNPDKIKAFVNGISTWTRDSYQDVINCVEYLGANFGSLSRDTVNNTNGVRPAFVIDLSQVDYTEAGHVDYK